MKTMKQGDRRGKEQSGNPFFKEGDNSAIWTEMSMQSSRDQPFQAEERVRTITVRQEKDWFE